MPARLTLHPSDRKAGGESGLYAQLTAGSQEPRNRAAPARCRLGSQMLGELARSVAPAPLAQALVALDGVLAEIIGQRDELLYVCLLYTSPSPRD